MFEKPQVEHTSADTWQQSVVILYLTSGDHKADIFLYLSILSPLKELIGWLVNFV